MDIDWKAFAEEFLRGTATYINEDKDAARAFREKLKEDAEEGKKVVIKMDVAAKSMLQQTTIAENLGATPGMIAAALTSGPDGITKLATKMQSIKNAYTSEGFAYDDAAKAEAITKVELPELYGADFAKPEGGWKTLVDKYFNVGAGTIGDYKAPQQSIFARAMGQNAKDYIRQDLDAEKGFMGLSTYDLSQLDGTKTYDIGDDTAGYLSWGDLNLFGQSALKNLTKNTASQVRALNTLESFQQLRDYTGTPKLTPYYNQLNLDRQIKFDNASESDKAKYDLTTEWKNNATLAARKYYQDQINQRVAEAITPDLLSNIQKYGGEKIFGNNPGLVTSFDNQTYPGFVASLLAAADDDFEVPDSTGTSRTELPNIINTGEGGNGDEETGSVPFNIEKVFSYPNLKFSVAAGESKTINNIFSEFSENTNFTNQISFKAIKTSDGFNRFSMRNNEENREVVFDFDPADNSIINIFVRSNTGGATYDPAVWEAMALNKDKLSEFLKIDIAEVEGGEDGETPPTFAEDDINAAVAVLGSDLDKYKTDGEFDPVKIRKVIQGWSINKGSVELKEALGQATGFGGNEPNMPAFINKIIETLGGTVEVSSLEEKNKSITNASGDDTSIVEKIVDSIFSKVHASTVQNLSADQIETLTGEQGLDEQEIEAILNIQREVIETKVANKELDVNDQKVKILINEASVNNRLLPKSILKEFGLYNDITNKIVGFTGSNTLEDNPFISKDALNRLKEKENITAESTIDADTQRDIARGPADAANLNLAKLIAAVKAGNIEEANILAQQIEEARDENTDVTPPVKTDVSSQGPVGVDTSVPTFDTSNIGLMSKPSIEVSEDESVTRPVFSSGLGAKENTDIAPTGTDEDPEISMVVDKVMEAVPAKSTLGRVTPNKLKVTNSQLRNAIVKALGGNNALPKNSKERKTMIDKIAKAYISRRKEEASK